MSVVELKTKKDYQDLISQNQYVAVQASATWCGPCKAISPLFAKHASEHSADSKYAFAKFDTDDVPDLAMELGIRTVPAFFFFKDGDLDDKVGGANPGALKTAVEAYATKLKDAGVSFALYSLSVKIDTDISIVLYE